MTTRVQLWQPPSPHVPVRIEFEPEEHRYLVNGVGYESVTTVLRIISKGERLEAWMIRKAANGEDPNELRDEGGRRGTIVHEVLGLLHADDFPSIADFQEAHRPYVQALARWYVDSRPKLVASEVMVCMPEWRVAGTLDYLRDCPGCPQCEGVGEGLILGDAKTSKELWDEQFVQVAAYVPMYEFCANRHVCSTELLRLAADGTYQVEPGVGDHQTFVHAMELQRHVRYEIPNMRRLARNRAQRVARPRRKTR